MKVLTAAQMRKIDEYAIEKLGIPSIVLMENAGIAVAQCAVSMLRGKCRGRRIYVFCGNGNNGGDGFVAARHLLNMGAYPTVFLIGKNGDLSRDALGNYKVFVSSGGDVFSLQGHRDIEAGIFKKGKPDLIIDAIFGTGLKKPVSGVFEETIRAINKSRVKVLSVDIPSGLDADKGIPLGSAVKADMTVTFAYAKLGLLTGVSQDYVGDLLIKDISIPKRIGKMEFTAELIEPTLVRSLLKPRAYSSHKGSHGHALIVAGSREKSGAAKLSAVSALRGGAGLVTLAVPESAHDLVKSSLYNVMSIPIPDDEKGSLTQKGAARVMESAKGMDVIAIGPGLVPGKYVALLITELMEKSDSALIVDADGLNSISDRIRGLKSKRANIVFTPHPGEMARLTGIEVSQIQAKRLDTARDFSLRHGVAVILKGYRTVVAFPDSTTYINTTGNPGMATAGMGDVLTGLLASYLAQQRDFKKGVLSAVFNHGLLGDLVSTETGDRGMLSSDLPNKLAMINRTLYPGKRFPKIEEI